MHEIKNTRGSVLLSQQSNVSDVGIDVRLPFINQSLGLLNESPIPAKNLENINWVDRKIQKLSVNLRCQLTGSSEPPYELHKDSNDLHAMLMSFKDKFHQEDTTRAQKLQLLTLLPSDWSVHKVAEIMGASEYMVKQSKHLLATKGILSTNDVKSGLYSFLHLG